MQDSLHTCKTMTSFNITHLKYRECFSTEIVRTAKHGVLVTTMEFCTKLLLTYIRVMHVLLLSGTGIGVMT